jgi:probable F420-dependent oxidoreductase
MALGPALVLAAEVTTRLRVGSFVFDNDFRHPAVLAHEAATVDVLTEGRFELGIGAGWMREEYDKTGIQFDDGGARVDRLAETLTIINGLFGPRPVTFKGAHYTITGLEGACKPVQQPHPPILIGGGGTRLLTIAASQADIISLMPRSKRDGSGLEDGDATAAAFDLKLQLVREVAGSRFEKLELNTLVQDVIVTDDAAAAATKLTGEWGLGVEDLLESPLLLIGTEDEIRHKLRRMRDRLRISYVTVFEKNMETLAPVIEPLLGG